MSENFEDIPTPVVEKTKEEVEVVMEAGEEGPPNSSPPPSPVPATGSPSSSAEKEPVIDAIDAIDAEESEPDRGRKDTLGSGVRGSIVGAGVRASLALTEHVKIDYDEDFELLAGDDLKIRWNMRRTAERPCLCCCQLCGGWVFLILLLILLVATVASIEFSLGVPFYDRSEINQQREDAYAATVEGADFLASFGGVTGECVHEDPTILTRNGTLIQGPAPSGSCQRTSTMNLRLLFITKDRKSNILTPENLIKIKEIEDKIINHIEWTRYCNLVDTALAPLTTRDASELQPLLAEAAGKDPTFTPCARIMSFNSLLDPLYFNESDGIGYHLLTSDQFPQEFDFSQENLDNVMDFWSTYTPRSYDLSGFEFAVATVGEQVTVPNYVNQLTSGDYGFGSTESIGVMSVLHLGLPTNGYESSTEAATDQYEEIGLWLWEEFDSFLNDASFGNVQVYWSDNQGGMLLAEEGALAIASFVLFPLSVFGVMVYLIIMQDSIFIGLAGIMQILLCFIPTLLLYRYVFGEDYVGVCNFYIILGVGVDDIFVFTDQFKIAQGGSDLTPRMQRTFNVASKAMFTTSCTTFISFISNATSVFPAVSTFGLFSALLVFVNFCAVAIFFPAVFAVYRTYVRHKWWDHPSLLICWRKEVPEEPVSEYGHEEATGLNKFFKETWAPLILKFRYILLALFFAVFVFALVLTVTSLEPDEEAPVTIPSGNNYMEYTDVLLDYFQKSDNPAATRVRWVSGIDPDRPIDRSGTDDTNLTDYGAATYLSCENFNPTTPEAQVWSLKTCHDMFFANVTEYHEGSDDFGPDGSNGNKARNMVNSIVKEDETNYYSKVKCVAQGFRDWLLTDRGCVALQELGLPCHAETAAREGCTTWDVENSCEPFPVPSSSWLYLIAAFIQDPALDPQTQTTNLDNYAEFIFVAHHFPDESLSIQPDYSCRTEYLEEAGEDLTIFAIVAEATTTESFAMNFRDGIDLYSRWDAWSAQMRKFAPQEMLGTMQISNGSWAFYFLNETLLGETFSGIGLALGLSFIVMSLVGGNVIMSFISVFNICLIVTNVFAFTVLAGYKLGVIEAVLYVVVIGLSIDYSVHMSEAYTEAHGETRTERVVVMVEEMGVSVLSGALSTLIASFFMFFAPNTFFVKFAAFLFVTIALSCIYALVLFPAALSVFGPLGDTGSLHKWFGRMKDNFIHEYSKNYLLSKEFIRREHEKVKTTLESIHGSKHGDNDPKEETASEADA
eukprot:scaffold2102_cov161-Amphora_coffeaeformis.AAC.37